MNPYLKYLESLQQGPTPNQQFQYVGGQVIPHQMAGQMQNLMQPQQGNVNPYLTMLQSHWGIQQPKPTLPNGQPLQTNVSNPANVDNNFGLGKSALMQALGQAYQQSGQSMLSPIADQGHNNTLPVNAVTPTAAQILANQKPDKGDVV